MVWLWLGLWGSTGGLLMGSDAGARCYHCSVQGLYSAVLTMARGREARGIKGQRVTKNNKKIEFQ